MHPVRELLLARRAAGGRSGGRADGAFVALAIEGGGSRGAYSGGMAAALDELGFADCFDAVFGASAGALTSAWFLAGQASTGVLGWSDPAVTRTVTNPWRLLRGGPVVDTRRLVEHIYPAVPMDFAAILANPATFHPLATDAATGQAADLHRYIHDPRTLRLALRASTGLPLLAGSPVELGGRRWVDAGLAEAVPFRSAVAAGASHVLVLRTRPERHRQRPPSQAEARIVSHYLRRVAPGAVAAWETRHDRTHSDERYLRGDRSRDNVAILQVHPPSNGPEVSRLCRDPFRMRTAVRHGQEAVLLTLG